MLLFYLDHHVEAAVAAGLRTRGVDVLKCAEDGTATWDDELLLDRALVLGRVISLKTEIFSRSQDNANKQVATLLVSPMLTNRA